MNINKWYYCTAGDGITFKDGDKSLCTSELSEKGLRVLIVDLLKTAQQYDLKEVINMLVFNLTCEFDSDSESHYCNQCGDTNTTEITNVPNEFIKLNFNKYNKYKYDN